MKYSTLFCIPLLFFCILQSNAQDIAQWKGPNRDGYFPSPGLLKNWPANGPTLLWSNENIGDGYGSIAVSSDKLFVNGKIDSLSYIFSFDLKGNLLWKSPNGNEFTGKEFAANFPGSRSTPTLYGDFVYACSAIGRIACYDKKTGKERWSVEMIRDFGGIINQHGFSESLLVDEKKVYCLPGGPQNNVVALDRLSGKVIWSSKALSDSASYCSPMMIKLPARNLLVTFSGHYLMGIDAQTGELLWSHRQAPHPFHQQCNTPIYANGFIYYLAGEGNGVVKLALSADGKSISEVWRNNATNNVFNGFVMIGNDIFSPDKTQKIKCIDGHNGNVIDSLRVNKGGLICSDSLLICYSENGDINLIKLTGTKMELTGKFKCDKGTKEHFAHPVISNGVLYIRHGKALMAYDIAQPREYK